MQLEVSIDGNFYNDIIKRAAVETLEYEGLDGKFEIEVMIADENEIKRINLEQRAIDKVTDVLYFPMQNDIKTAKPDIETGAIFLGSTVICKQKAIAQSAEYGHSIEREVAFLTVHSTLHLLGYDHELSDKDEQLMFNKQREILNKMGVVR